MSPVNFQDDVKYEQTCDMEDGGFWKAVKRVVGFLKQKF